MTNFRSGTGVKEAGTDKASVLSYKVSDAALFLIFLLLSFQNILQKHFGGVFSYVDEFSALLLCFWACFNLAGNKTGYSKLLRRLLFITVPFLFLGLCGNIAYKLQPSYQAVAIDTFTCAKFVLTFISGTVLLTQRPVVDAAVGFARLVLPALLFFFFVNLFVDLGFTTGERAGYAFLYGHPTMLAAVVVCLVSVLLLDVESNKFQIICGLAVLFATGRFKAIGFAFIIAAAVFLYPNRKRIPLSFIVVAGCGALFLVYNQIALYFLDTHTARSVLLTTSFDVANSHWPLGSGFATYGSNASGDYYPQFYYSLGFQNVFGLGPLEHSYLVDSFWPAVIGQCGYIGLVLIVTLFVLLFGVAREAVKRGLPLWASISIPIYLLICSTSEASIFASYSVLIAMTFALLITSNRISSKGRK